MQSSFFISLFLLMSVLSMVLFQAALGFHLWSSPFLHFSFSHRGKSFLWVGKGLAPGGTEEKNPPANAEGARDGFDSWVGSPVSLPGKSHGQRSLAGYSPWGRRWLDTTEQLHTHSPEEKNISLPLATGGKGC